jgi:homoserine dehydrogenase
MKAVNIILMGFGNVGQAFLRVAHEKKELCVIRYGLDIKFYSIFELGGAIHFSRFLNRSKILIISNTLLKTDFTLDAYHNS